jgi:hypothetical protein
MKAGRGTGDLPSTTQKTKTRWTILKWNLREIRWDGMDWTDLAQDRGTLEGSCEHGNEPLGSTKCWEVLE